MPVVSVIIPVKNGAGTLVACLEAIRAQTMKDIEIIVLDSESGDDSKVIAESYGAAVYPVEAGRFNHGLTRNDGVRYAKSSLLYFTVQDARIADERMLQTMAGYFDDAAVQSVTGMQATPHENDKNPVRWFRRYSAAVEERRQFPFGKFALLSPKEQLKMSRWDNVNSMYRRSALVEQPFGFTEFAEDIMWAKAALERGWMIVRDASLVVYHYHHQSFRYTFRVNYSEFYILRMLFGIKPSYPNIVKDMLIAVKLIFRNEALSFLEKIKWIFHNLWMNFGRFLSVLVFRSFGFWGGQRLVDNGLKIFCSSVPQGKQQKSIRRH